MHPTQPVMSSQHFHATLRFVVDLDYDLKVQCVTFGMIS